MILPEAAWRTRPGLSELTAVLGAADSRFVGGAVRDTWLGLPVSDIDIATRHTPGQVMELLGRAGIRVVPTGLAHGTVTALTDGGPVEVTTLRRDVATDGRHAVVAYTDDWRVDASRRDFTINALYADPATGELFDYFGGIADLNAGRVRFIGDPLRRIGEDHLRILRFFRFHARFGEAVDADGLAACTARANDQMALSRERIAAELLKLLVARHAVATMQLMVEHGILAAVLPEIDAAGTDRLARLAQAELACAIAPDAIRRLAVLIPPDVAERVGARLKLSNADRRRLESATAGPGHEGPLGLAYRVGSAMAIDRLLIAGEDPTPVIDWVPPARPVGGGALVALGIAKGPDVARGLKMVEARWIAEGFPDADRVEAITGEVAAQILGGAIIA